MSPRPPRSTAEWTTFAASSLVLAVLLLAVVLHAAVSDDPAAPVAGVDGAIERRGERFHVPVTVTNEGDQTAEAVQVLLSVDIDGETVDADQTVDFLAGGDRRRIIFVLDKNPAGHELTVRVTGFTVP